MSRAGKVTVNCVGVLSFPRSASCPPFRPPPHPAPSSRFACRSEVAQEPNLLLVRSQERGRRPWRYRSSNTPSSLDVARQCLLPDPSQVKPCSVEEWCCSELRTEGPLASRDRDVNEGTCYTWHRLGFLCYLPLSGTENDLAFLSEVLQKMTPSRYREVWSSG